MPKHGKLRIIPLGGLGEVGKNMTAYEFDHQILIVDAGIMFPENDMLGIDYIIPDYNYLRDKANQILGIVITHGHEDHIGAIPHVLNDFPVPVYATPLTRGLIEVKLARQQRLEQRLASHRGSGKIHPAWTVQGGVLSHLAFHSRCGWTWHYHACRPRGSHERFQIRSHARGWLADRLRKTDGVRRARRGLVAFRFNQFGTPRLDAIRNGDWPGVR